MVWYAVSDGSGNVTQTTGFEDPTKVAAERAATVSEESEAGSQDSGRQPLESAGIISQTGLSASTGAEESSAAGTSTADAGTTGDPAEALLASWNADQPPAA